MGQRPRRDHPLHGTEELRFRKGSLADRLMAFFRANPLEELTYGDIMTKFEVTYTNVADTLRRLRAAKLIEVTRTLVRLPCRSQNADR